MLTGNLGMSVSTGRPVAEDLARVFPATLEMATLGILIGVLLGVPMGVIAANRQGSWIDQAIRVVGLLGYSVPAFWLGLVGLAVFYARLGWVAGPGRIDVFYDGLVPPVTGLLIVDSLIAGDPAIFGNAVSHLILPASILGFFSLAYIARMTRSFMLDQLGQEFITTARVKGVPERRVLWVHAFRPIRVPLITVIGLSYAGLLEGSVMIETVFSWPGIGNYLTTALLNADMNAVLGRDAGDRRGLHLHQQDLRRALPRPRPEEPLDERARLAARPLARDLVPGERRAGLAHGRRAHAQPAGGGGRDHRDRPRPDRGLRAAGSRRSRRSARTSARASCRRAPSTGWAPTSSAATSSPAWSGARASRSLIVALVAMIAAPLGLVIGAVSGYFGGWTDKLLMGVTDVFLSMPKLILALAFVAALGPGIKNAHHRHRRSPPGRPMPASPAPRR